MAIRFLDEGSPSPAPMQPAAQPRVRFLDQAPAPAAPEVPRAPFADDLDEVYRTYPRLKGPDWQIVDSRSNGIQNGRRLEFYPPDEAMNPNPGKPTLQLYDPALQGPSLRTAIAGDMLHHLPKTDPTFSQMRDRFASTMTPQQREVDERVYRESGDPRSFDDWFAQSRLDAYLRGYLTPDDADEWRQQRVYTPQQQRILTTMDRYLRAPQVTLEPQPVPGATMGRVESGLGSAAQGAASVVSGIPKSMAIAGSSQAQDAVAVMDQIDRGEGYSVYQVPQQFRPFVQRYERGDTAARAAIREQFAGALDPRESPAYKAGQAIDRAVADAVPSDPAYADEFLTTKVPQALGSTAGFLATGVLGRAVGVPGMVGAAATGAATMAPDQFEDALAHGADVETAIKAAGQATLPGMSEALPIGRLIDRLDKGTGGSFRRLLVETLKQGTEEAIQEFTQQVWQNAIAQGLYDPARNLLTDAPENAGVGFTVGALMEFVLGLATHRRGRAAPGGTAQQSGQQERQEPFLGDTPPADPTGEPIPISPGNYAQPMQGVPEGAMPAETVIGATPDTTWSPDGGQMDTTPPRRSRDALMADLADPRSRAEIEADEAAAEEAARPQFTATADWQEVPEGAVLPPGLEVRMDTETGRNMARMPAGTGTASDPVKITTPEDVTRGAEQTATPTPAQAEAGNYTKRHVKWNGLDISIETEAGQQRSGVGPNGPWSVTMPAPYGYIRRTEGSDGDHVDIYMGPDPQSNTVYVIDQIDPATGKFDEHKAMLGFDMGKKGLDLTQAPEWVQTYFNAFSDGSGAHRIGAFKAMSVDEFKTWLAKGDTTKPLSYKAPANASGARAETPPAAEGVGQPADAMPTDRAMNAARAAIGSMKGALDPAKISRVSNVPVEEVTRALQFMASKGQIRQNAKTGRFTRHPKEGPLSALEFLASKGGVRDDEGHALRQGRNAQRSFPRYGALIRDTGLSLDYAGEALWEAGYFGPLESTPRPTVAQTLDFIERGLRGEKLYAENDRNEIAAREEAAALAEQEARAKTLKQEIQAVSDDNTYGLTPEEIEAAAELVREGMSVDEAVVEVMERSAIAAYSDALEEIGDAQPDTPNRTGEEAAEDRGGDWPALPGEAEEAAPARQPPREDREAQAEQEDGESELERTERESFVARDLPTDAKAQLPPGTYTIDGIKVRVAREKILAVEPGYFPFSHSGFHSFATFSGNQPTTAEIRAQKGVQEKWADDWIKRVVDATKGSPDFTKMLALTSTRQWLETRHLNGQPKIPDINRLSPKQRQQFIDAISAALPKFQAVDWKKHNEEMGRAWADGKADESLAELRLALEDLPPQNATADEIEANLGTQDDRVQREADRIEELAERYDFETTYPQPIESALADLEGEGRDHPFLEGGDRAAQVKALTDEKINELVDMMLDKLVHEEALRLKVHPSGRQPRGKAQIDAAKPENLRAEIQRLDGEITNAIAPYEELFGADAAALLDREASRLATENWAEIRKERFGQPKPDSEKSSITPNVKSPVPPQPPAQSSLLEEPKPPKAGDKIEDFGEKLEGARKHYAAEYRDRMADAQELDVTAEPLSKTWPEPDYEKLLEGGTDPWTVGFVRSARDEVPTKPQKSWKLQSWVANVTALRKFANDLLTGKVSQADLRKAMDRPEFIRLRNHIQGRIDLYEAVGHSKSLKGVTLSEHSYSFYNGERYNPPRVIWSVEKAAKATAFGNWPRELGTGATREEAVADFKKKFAALDPAEPASREISFTIYSRRGVTGFIIGKKVGKDYIDLKTFDDSKAARDYLKNNKEELVKLLEKSKEIPPHRRLTNSPRVGIDHRNGGDVTPEQFMEAFGFRGVQFGNYVEGPRRQQDLNQAYDALMDLAGVIGVPSRALSLNGALGLAFGARGKGGKNPAAAHYETGNVVINLTKGGGAGSLAHEWWHSLDNYFSRARGQKIDFVSERAYERGEGVRPEVVKAFAEINAAIKLTALHERSRQLDRRRSKDYWSTGREMTARAFESYVIAKLADQSASNDYLANIVSESSFDLEGGYPYLKAAEIPAVRAAYDNFFNTVETRDTEEGVAMFAKRDVAAINSPAFKSWFGESKVVDEEGLPKMVFHGTSSNIEAFDNRSRGGLIYFAENPEFANGYALYKYSGEHLAIKEIFVEDHPDVLKGNGTIDADALWKHKDEFLDQIGLPDDVASSPQALVEVFNEVGFPSGANVIPAYLRATNPHPLMGWREAEKMGAERFKKDGYDSVWVRDDGGERTIAVFDPSQIKSINNRGSFNSNDTRISYAKRGAVQVPADSLGAPNTPIRQLRQRAYTWYRENLLDKSVVNEATGQKIAFDGTGSKKTVWGRGEDLIRLVPAIPEILRKAELVGTVSDRHGDTNVKAWHSYRADVRLGDRAFGVVLKVREMADGTYHYSLHKENVGGPSETEAGQAAKAARVAALEGAPDVEVNISLEPARSKPADRASVFNALRAELDRMNLSRVALKLPEQIAEGTADGVYLRRVIAVAMDAANKRGVLHHEAVHAMKRLGMFGAAEWRALEQMARDKWLSQYEIAKRYPELSEAAQAEEAVAHAFADYMAGTYQPKGLAERAFAYMRRLLEAIKSTLAGQGFKRWEDVFEAAAEGRIGARDLTGKAPRIEPVFKSSFSEAYAKRTPETETTDQGENFTLGFEKETPEQVAARKRREDRERAEAAMVGKKKGAAGQQTADDLPLFGGDRQKPMFAKRDDKAVVPKLEREPATVQDRQNIMLTMLAGKMPIDRALRVPFAIFGGVDRHGEWQPGAKLFDGAADKIKNAKFTPHGRFAFINPALEVARRNLIDRYGLTDEYVARDRARALDERRIQKKGLEFLTALKESGVGPEEAKVLQAVLTGESLPVAEWEKVSAPIRQAIDELGAEAVELGLVSKESYERNRGTYLHRVYLKHESDLPALARWTAQMMGKKRKKIVGDELKGRGIFLDVEMPRLLAHDPEFKDGAAGRAVDGQKFIVLDRHESDDLLETDRRPKVVERVFWPADRAVPQRYQGKAWTENGTWQVRGVKGNKVTIWRDYTKEERERMGEILDARYTIGKTFMLMSHDLASGRFYRDIAMNNQWARNDQPNSRWVDAADYNRYWASPDIDWVKVPETEVPNSGGKKRYGALAGKWVRSEIWRDMNEVDQMNRPNLWQKLLTQWKLNKTARSPVVHMNNVMSNLMFMDMADVPVSDLVRAVKAYATSNKDYQEAADAGAFGSDMMSVEIRKNILEPVLKELQGEALDGRSTMEAKLGVLGKLAEVIWSKAKAADEFMKDAYRIEDEVFRMAVYLRRRSQGDTPTQAADHAREQFLDYDIRAPLVNLARRTFLPFIGYVYRAVPVIARSIASHPWKLGKYFLIAYLANALAYAIDDDDDEDYERRSMRDEERGYTWLGVPRMIRMPWRDQNGNPVFLDIRRWIPAGDIFDMGQGSSALPIPAPLLFSGPLMLAAELFLNRSAFTGQDIVNKLTDDVWDRVSKVGDYLYKAWLPSAAWVPNSWYWNKIENSVKGVEGAPTITQSALSSVGVKVGGQDIERNMSWRAYEFKKVERELKFEAGRIARQYQRGMISEKAFNNAMNDLVAKSEKLKEKAEERLKGPASPSK